MKARKAQMEKIESEKKCTNECSHYKDAYEEYVATAAELAEIDVDNTDSLLGKSTNIPYFNRSPKNLMSRTHDFDGIIFCSFQGCSQKSA